MKIHMKLLYSTILIAVLIGVVEKITTIRAETKLENIYFILGSSPNFFTVFFSCLVISIISTNGLSYSIGYLIGVVIYEFMQIYMPERTFDILDIVFSILGFLVFYLIFKLFSKLKNKRQSEAGNHHH